MSAQFKDLKAQDIKPVKPKVYIVVPTLDGHIYHLLAINMINWSHSNRFEPYITFEVHKFPHDSMRNIIVENFLSTDCDYLCMIDNDIVPSNDSIDKLLDRNVDVISPVCLNMKAFSGILLPPEPVAYRKNQDQKSEVVFDEGLQEVDCASMGMCLIKRSVFSKLSKPYFNFTYDENGIMVVGEDTNFFKKVNEAGIKQYVDFSITTRHIKEVDLLGIQGMLVRTIDGINDINKKSGS